MEMDENATLAVLVTEMKGLQNSFDEERKARKEDFADLRRELKEFHGDKVSRDEWLMRNAHVDEKFDSHGEDISEIKQDMASKHVPVTAWIALIISGLMFGWTLLGPVLTRG